MWQRFRGYGRLAMLYGSLITALLVAVMIHRAARDEQTQTAPPVFIGTPVMLRWTPNPKPVPDIIVPDERYLRQPPGQPFPFNGQTYYLVPLG